MDVNIHFKENIAQIIHYLLLIIITVVNVCLVIINLLLEGVSNSAKKDIKRCPYATNVKKIMGP